MNCWLYKNQRASQKRGVGYIKHFETEHRHTPANQKSSPKQTCDVNKSNMKVSLLYLSLFLSHLAAASLVLHLFHVSFSSSAFYHHPTPPFRLLDYQRVLQYFVLQRRGNVQNLAIFTLDS